jgi:hypothetical protein
MEGGGGVGRGASRTGLAGADGRVVWPGLSWPGLPGRSRTQGHWLKPVRPGHWLVPGVAVDVMELQVGGWLSSGAASREKSFS